MLKDRIKKLRKALDLTQQEFANRLGISRGNVATYETREGSPGSSVISLICREFNVNEAWLRTGEGEMFNRTEQSAVERLCAELHANELESKIIRAYFKIDPKIRDPFIQRIIQEMKDETAPAQPEAEERAQWEREARAEAEEVYRQVLEEKKAEAGSSASPRGTSRSKMA